MIKLSDNIIDDRLRAALEALGTEPGETVPGNAALTAARKALSMLSLALLVSAERRAKDPAGGPHWPVADRVIAYRPAPSAAWASCSSTQSVIKNPQMDPAHSSCKRPARLDPECPVSDG